jgi:hypothetical protein
MPFQDEPAYQKKRAILRERGSAELRLFKATSRSGRPGPHKSGIVSNAAKPRAENPKVRVGS